MRISAAATVHAPAEQVWDALSDPDVLAGAIPGCERLEQAGPDEYLFVMAGRVATMEGRYIGRLSLSERRRPAAFVLTARAAGGQGTVVARAQVSLTATADGCTEVSYDADASVSGAIAGVGQLVLTGLAQRKSGDLLRYVDDVLAGTPEHSGDQCGMSAPAMQTSGSVPLVPSVPSVTPVRFRLARSHSFARGVLVGAAIALGAVVAGSQIGRRTR